MNGLSLARKTNVLRQLMSINAGIQDVNYRNLKKNWPV